MTQGKESDTQESDAPPLELHEIESNLTSLLKKVESANKRSLSTYHEIGVQLIEARHSGLLAHGYFGEWCSEKFGIGKSQRADYMRLAREWNKIPAARAWASKEGLGNNFNTMSDVLKLLGQHKRFQDKPKRTNERSHQASKILRSLSDGELRLVPKAYALWADPSADAGTASTAEFRLLRWAARKGVSIQVYLSAFGLKVPMHRNFGEADAAGSLRLAA